MRLFVYIFVYLFIFVMPFCYYKLITFYFKSFYVIVCPKPRERLYKPGKQTGRCNHEDGKALFILRLLSCLRFLDDQFHRSSVFSSVFIECFFYQT